MLKVKLTSKFEEFISPPPPEKERKERKDMLKAGQSRSSVVCVNGVMHHKA